jgi:hypothetical protein
MSSRWVAVAALCAGLTAGLCGCNNARLVRWDGSTGVVAIPRNDDSWPEHNREHAEDVMREKCPRGYTIVDEQEVVTGQVQHTSVQSNQSGNPTLAALHLDSVKTHTNETTTVEDRKEWRITFRSADAPPAGVIQTSASVPVVTPPVPPGLPSQPVPVGQ